MIFIHASSAMQNTFSTVRAGLAAAATFALLACGKPAPSSPPQAEATPSVSTQPPQQEKMAAASASPAQPPELSTAAQPQASPAAAAASGLQDPVATVDGEPITRRELEQALDQAAEAEGVSLSELTEEQKMEGYRQLLNSMIMDKLLSKAAAGVVVSEEEIQAEIERVKNQFPSEEEFQSQLAAAGESLESLKKTLARVIQKRHWVASQIEPSTTVSEEEARKFYEENKAEFEQPELVKASHILFRVPKDAPEEQVQAALDKARKAAERAKKEDFTALAKELSEEPGANESGGDLGYFSAEQMVPEFTEAAFSLQPGQISEPVRTQFGWHIIKVEDRKPAGTTPFEDVQDQLEAFLKAGKQRQAFQDLMKSLRDKADIKTTLPEGGEGSADGN